MRIFLTNDRNGPPPARVLTQLSRGSATRDEISRMTGLSHSTVSRTITTLNDLGLVREVPGHSAAGSVGRPTVPVEIDPEEYCVVGCHLSAQATTVSLGDLQGRLLDTVRVPTGPDEESIARDVAQAVKSLLSGRPSTTALLAGLVAPWGDLDLDETRTADAIAAVLGFDVAAADFVSALVALDVMGRHQLESGVTLYVYAGHTLGTAIALERGSGIDITRAGRLAHFPTGGEHRCSCGRTGCFGAAASDAALVAQARDAGIIDQPSLAHLLRAAANGHLEADRLLIERAERLGQIAGIVHDFVHPDQTILCGPAMTGYTPAIDVTIAALRAQAVGPIGRIALSPLSPDVGARASVNVARQRVYADPTQSQPFSNSVITLPVGRTRSTA